MCEILQLFDGNSYTVSFATFWFSQTNFEMNHYRSGGRNVRHQNSLSEDSILTRTTIPHVYSFTYFHFSLYPFLYLIFFLSSCVFVL